MEKRRIRSLRSRSLRVVGSLAFLGTLCGLVAGIPVVGSGPISIPHPNTDFVVWPPPPRPGQLTATVVDKSKPVGVRVGLTTGSGYIMALPYGCPPSTTAVQIGQMSAGRAAVFEGVFQSVLLRSSADATPLCDGDYVDRAPTDGSVADGSLLVGDGHTALLPSGEFGVYGSYGPSGGPPPVRMVPLPRQRLLLARCSQPLTIGWGESGTLLVDAGDWGLCSQNVARYGLSGAAGQTVDFQVLAPLASAQCTAQTPVEFGQSGVDGDVDACALDGMVDLAITIVNGGDSTVTVTWRVKNQAEHVDTLLPHATLTPALAGALDELELRYTNTTNASYVNPVTLTVVAHP
jgi:hypothetical protein